METLRTDLRQAANEKGKYNGIQQRIIETNPRTLTACLAHSLNLVVISS